MRTIFLLVVASLASLAFLATVLATMSFEAGTVRESLVVFRAASALVWAALGGL